MMLTLSHDRKHSNLRLALFTLASRRTLCIHNLFFSSLILVSFLNLNTKLVSGLLNNSHKTTLLHSSQSLLPRNSGIPFW